MKNLIKKILKESAGISFEVREWSDILYKEIMSQPDQHHGKGRIIVDGYDYPETYDKFSVDYFVIDFYDTMTGYDQTKSGYDKDGYYVVILYLQPRLVGDGDRYTLKSALNHELKHAYQDYQRITKGHGNIDSGKESSEFYTADFIRLLNSRQHEGPIKHILKYYYYLSNLERDAYLENIYDGHLEYENYVKDVINNNFNRFRKTYNLQPNWRVISSMDIPLLKKFNKASDFINYSEKRLKNKADKIIKKINKMKYIHGID